MYEMQSRMSWFVVASLELSLLPKFEIVCIGLDGNPFIVRIG